MDTAEAARRWVEGWLRGWRAHDVHPIAALYANDAVFRSHPFREPHLGPSGARDYARWAFESEEAVEPRFGEPIVAGDRAVVEYWATIVGADGGEETLAGVAVICFAPDGRVTAQRDYWAVEKGHRPPPDGWGR